MRRPVRPKNSDSSTLTGTLAPMPPCISTLWRTPQLGANAPCATSARWNPAEFLAAEAAHDGSVDHGAPQFGEIEIAVMGREAAARQIADEAAGEGIARAGRVEYVFQQIARHHEVLAAAEQD